MVYPVIVALLQAGGVADSAAAGAAAARSLAPVQQVLVGGFAAVLAALLGLTVWMLLRLSAALREGDMPRIESHWGGIGGGLGGWQLSRSLAYVLAAVTFASLFTLTFNRGVAVLQSTPPGGAGEGQANETGADSTSHAAAPATTPAPAAGDSAAPTVTAD